MPSPKPDWTAEKLERSLRRWVKARHLHIRSTKFRPDDCSAMAHFNAKDGRKRRYISWDPMQIGKLTGVIHELVEIHLDRELDRWGNLREAVVVALENSMVLKIEGNPESVKWWRKALDEREE